MSVWWRRQRQVPEFWGSNLPNTGEDAVTGFVPLSFGAVGGSPRLHCPPLMMMTARKKVLECV